MTNEVRENVGPAEKLPDSRLSGADLLLDAKSTNVVLKQRAGDAQVAVPQLGNCSNSL